MTICALSDVEALTEVAGAGLVRREARVPLRLLAKKKGAHGGNMVSPVLKAVALFLPGIGVVVVAVALPEAGLVDRRELDAA